MAPPTVRVNTFVEPSKKSCIDLITKIFIICEIPFGIIRLPLLGNVKNIFMYLSITYAFVIVSLVLGFMCRHLFTNVLNIIVLLAAFQYVFYVIFNFIMVRRLQSYYNELNSFDMESRKLKIGRESIKNMVQMLLALMYKVVMFIMSHVSNNVSTFNYEMLPGVGAYILELYYNGHLLSLLTPRLRLINYYMELSLANKKPNANEINCFENDTKKSLLKMEKLMGLYHIIIKAYGYLYDAIKWQLLVTLVCTFMASLCYCYHFSFQMIRGNGSITLLLSFITQIIGIIIPLFAPCMQADNLQSEVRRLRELLASRLYENRLDKCIRGVARALLAWTETRDLSFSLLRMLHVDISLPFKFVGLLITYLIILLQFEKVINP